MTKSGDPCCRALVAAAAVLSCLELLGCGAEEPLFYAPSAWLFAGEGAGPTGGVRASPVSGHHAPLPEAGNTDTAGANSGQSGTGVPVAGFGVIVAGSSAGAGPNPELPAFDAGSDPNRNKLQAGALCARLATINCAAELHCCINPGRSVESCRATLMTSCGETHLDVISQNPITGFDRDLTERAFGQLEQKAAACDPTVATWAESVDGLRGIFKGTKAPNTSCKPAQNFMDPVVAGAALTSCTGAATTACLPRSLLGDWTCAPKNPGGATCVTDMNCQSGLFCSNASMTALGRCAQRAAVGANCMDATQCASLYCRSGKCVAATVQNAYCMTE